MTDDISRLGFEIDSSDAKKASSDLDGLTSSAKETEKQADRLKPTFDKTSYSLKGVSGETGKAKREFDGLSSSQRSTSIASNSLASSASRLIIPLVSLTASISALNSAFGSVQEFERFEAQLTTATGSIERAGLELESLNSFATSTPFQLSEVVDAFVRLKNLGLDPSQEALISYGNTASSMGKSLNQFIEAVADATVGEFERLKEFGIKARSEGDNVAFTFAGVTTTIQKSASDIEGYLQELGNTAFAGAMERRTDDLEVSFSNLGIATDKLSRKLADESGLTGAAKAAANALTSLFNSFTGAPRSVEIVESEIDRLTAALETSANPRSGATLRNQLKELREELQLSRSISNDSGEVGKAIATLDKQIEQYRSTLAGFGDRPPEERIDTRRGSRTNPAFERYEQANTQLEAALKQREALLDRKAELSKIAEDSEGSVEVKGALTGLTEEQLADRISKVRESLYTEEEEIAASFVRRQETLADYLATNGDFETEYRELTLANVEGFNDKMVSLDKKRADAQVKITEKAEREKARAEERAQRVRLQSQQAYASIASNIIFAAFGNSKDARRAQALISTYQAANDAMADSTGLPGPLKIASAAAIVAAGLKNVSMIDNVNIGSGGGGGSASYSAGTVGQTAFNTPVISQQPPEQQQEARVQVIFNGSVTGLDEDILAEKISELVDRDYITVSAA